MKLEIQATTSEQANKNFLRDYGRFYSKYLLSTSEETNQRVGFLAATNAATALISGCVSLIGGARNLKREEPTYRLEVSITNYTSYLIALVEADVKNAMFTAPYIMPGQEASIIFTEKVGNFSDSSSLYRYSPIIYMQMISSNGSSQGIECGIADQTDSTSRTICMSHMSGGGSSWVENPALNNTNIDLHLPIFYFTNADNAVISVKPTVLSNDESAVLDIIIVERVG
ncbi:hypothetical protein VOA_000253 [Vibrio sp. RC586]|uniref:hypothetical protein n=1 Tax=Vibrio sp. RC586 TaxID=675815 RepID=UPI0001BB83A8|nr:hypothetical protein [Vibrio sp. RC586]EEZ00201.1 hypothetical protein VOA_000253 [Vibrio sp. RC586]